MALGVFRVDDNTFTLGKVDELHPDVVSLHRKGELTVEKIVIRQARYFWQWFVPNGHGTGKSGFLGARASIFPRDGYDVVGAQPDAASFLHYCRQRQGRRSYQINLINVPERFG